MKKPPNPLIQASISGAIVTCVGIVFVAVSSPDDLFDVSTILWVLGAGGATFLSVNNVSIWRYKHWEDKKRIREEGIDVTELTPPDFDK
ncbi:MAG: hypothetical protein RIC16_05690 [Rhodospirillales bacterium]